MKHKVRGPTAIFIVAGTLLLTLTGCGKSDGPSTVVDNSSRKPPIPKDAATQVKAPEAPRVPRADAEPGSGKLELVESVVRPDLKDVNCLGARGVIAVFGSASGAVEPFDIAALARVGGYVTRTGMGHYTGTRAEWLRRSNELLGWVQTGKLKVRSTEYPLADAARAHTDLQGRKTVGKLLLIP